MFFALSRRVTCRIKGHIWALSDYDSLTELSLYHCMRCYPSSRGVRMSSRRTGGLRIVDDKERSRLNHPSNFKKTPKT